MRNKSKSGLKKEKKRKEKKRKEKKRKSSRQNPRVSKRNPNHFIPHIRPHSFALKQCMQGNPESELNGNSNHEEQQAGKAESVEDVVGCLIRPHF